jgi:hypothetical protein
MAILYIVEVSWGTKYQTKTLPYIHVSETAMIFPPLLQIKKFHKI